MPRDDRQEDNAKQPLITEIRTHYITEIRKKGCTMKTLVVLCHPSADSLTAHLADHVMASLQAGGHDATLHDLYQEGYDPRLTAEEFAAYNTAIHEDAEGLQSYQAMVLVFPTWWSGLPAMLKGWIDRSFLPGTAFVPDPINKTIRPRLTKLRHIMVITTLGGPAWIDRLVLRCPVYRILKWGVFKACSPKARFVMFSLYRSEGVSTQRLAQFKQKITNTVANWRPQ